MTKLEAFTVSSFLVLRMSKKNGIPQVTKIDLQTSSDFLASSPMHLNQLCLLHTRTCVATYTHYLIMDSLILSFFSTFISLAMLATIPSLTRASAPARSRAKTTRLSAPFSRLSSSFEGSNTSSNMFLARLPT